MKKLLYLLTLVLVVACAKPTTERPLIGISCGADEYHATLHLAYVNAVYKGGGTPVLIPPMTDSVALLNILQNLDGVIMSGGEDVAPAYYGEEPHEKLGYVNDFRDTYDLILARMAHDMGMPMLGICRGVQLINVLFGGTLVQDIPAQRPEWNLIHRPQGEDDQPMHDVSFEADSQLAKMFGTTELNTNSRHHQAVKDVAPGFRLVAKASDGTSEAIESIEGKPIWGTQFHPELMVEAGDDTALNIFKAFVEKANDYRKTKCAR